MRFFTDTRSVTALNDISLDIRAGEFLSLLGPSGCGKSTFLRVVADLIPPTGGSLTVLGVTPETARLRRDIGFVFQDAALLPWRTALQNVALPLEVARGKTLNTKPARATPRELLELVGLKGSEDAFPHELSGGMRQRVSIARALVSDPRILLMDEPFGALDPIIRARAQEDLRRIQRKLGSTIMLVTHDMEEAIRLADRIAVMDAGRLVQYAAPAEIITHPATDFVADMVGEVERPLRLLSLIPVSHVVVDGPAEGAASASDASLRDALSACLWTGRTAVPVEQGGVKIGHVTLDAIRGCAEFQP